MPERISSVYDIPEWLEERLPRFLTGPARAAGNALMLPVDVGADLLRRGAHGALGLEESEPYRYSGERMHRLSGALGDTASSAGAPVRLHRRRLRLGRFVTLLLFAVSVILAVGYFTGIEVLWDDRDERAGVKFNDADLLGTPFQLVVGDKSLAQGVVEWKSRKTGETVKIAPDQVVAHAQAQIRR